ncbi:DoxX family protein [Muribacter muris]|uniref:DoxX family protein n=1 Tax=Muribacter muris TaxID=67855 RepID=A0A4Y9K3C2_9PAST|nr:DoxX family protein [Muribacter muris]MBF0784529.1 DoxX family protein [Muribacter muris]MBF0826175.1 DoxX family protein [Muribacter muris]TFV12042.1 DoxX family protein [Muribacter muris]
MNTFSEKLTPMVFLLVRLVVGYMFLLHGTAKFFEFPVSMTGGNGSVELMSQYGVAGTLEIIGGSLFILGLLTRPVAFLLSGMMAFAYFGVHASAETLFQPMLNHGELAALYSVVFLLFVFIGAGKWSLDHKLFAKNETSKA